MDDGQRRGAIVDWVRKVGDPWIQAEHPPAPGSSLAADDKVLPRVSELARFGIATAVDHLGMVVDAMETDRPFRHYGPITTLRTSLLASARTKWLMEPSNRVERQIRALMIEIQNQTEQRKAIDALSGDHMSPELVAGRIQAIEVINDHIQELKDRAAELRPTDELKKLPDTASIIRGLVDEHSDEGQAVRHLWRTGSATAHGYHWSTQLTGEPGQFDEQWFNTSLYGSMLLVNDALELYEIRATNHVGTA